jgi:hypothetical protein
MPTTRSANEQAHLFAAYVELTHMSGDDEVAVRRRRRQWVILPQMPARLAPGDSPITGCLTYFEREQRDEKHRAVWEFQQDTSGSFTQTLSRTIDAYQEAGWKVSPVVTCEIHPTELAQILKDRKTPYRILNRLRKVAKGLHRLDIS